MRTNISTYLHTGRDNAIPARQLAAIIGMDERSMRTLIERARKNGEVILSDIHGYYLPSENEAEAIAEIQAFLRLYNARAITNRLSVKSARKALKTLTESGIVGQESLFNGEAQNVFT